MAATTTKSWGHPVFLYSWLQSYMLQSHETTRHAALLLWDFITPSQDLRQLLFSRALILIFGLEHKPGKNNSETFGRG